MKMRSVVKGWSGKGHMRYHISNTMNYKLILTLILYTISAASCEKENLFLITDLVTKDRYYDNEIFNEENQNIYGKWEFLYYSGGIAGGTYEPTYDFLEIVRYGIYGIIEKNEVRELGKIIINKQESDETIITFSSDDIHPLHILGQSNVNLQGKDTLVLWDNFADGYFSFFKRVK